jgi:hypothetical protein
VECALNIIEMIDDGTIGAKVGYRV